MECDSGPLPGWNVKLFLTSQNDAPPYMKQENGCVAELYLGSVTPQGKCSESPYIVIEGRVSICFY
jgi:hypothetical protein